jgi:peptidoglycan/LPS O-acetylase OafA/YrhL
LPIGIAMFLLYSYFPNISESSRDISLIRSITLFPIGNPALPVAWTLSYEMMFYLLFGLCFISRKTWNIFIILWASAIIIFNYFFPINYENLIFLNPYCLEFILGYLICLLYFYRINIKKYILWLCAIIFFCLTVTIKVYNLNLFDFSSNLMFAISVSFLILAVVINQTSQWQLSRNKILLLLGNASFSIYLVHPPIMSFLIRLLHSNSRITFYIFMTICCLGGILYYFIFEKFILGRAKRFVFKK